ncbi:FecR family protein [Formosa sp. 3Alg 14/1]|uniref:FecR family protein n=1 Tax=unclassified Formosa TaxID=2644710 RepID=UPI0039BDE4F3
MTQKEFLKLADKYDQGKCSSKEKALLFKFCDQAQFESLLDTKEFPQEAQTKIRLYKRILQTIKDNDFNKRRSFMFKRVRNIAAILVAASLVSYFFLQQNFITESQNLAKEITLELEDGTIQIVKENDNNAFFNKNGGILSIQKGNRLFYSNVDSVSKLIYNILTVPYGKKIELELSDGTTAFLNSGTSIKYPSKFIKNKKRQIYVTGEVFLSVAKDSLHPFVVNANGLNISVLGTEFNLSAYPEDKTTEVVLVEGAVALYNDSIIDKNNRIILKPGERAVFNKASSNISTNSVITKPYTSWMNGELVFRNMTFENITKKLERHYDVKVLNRNKEINKTIFNASFGKASIEEILESLKENYGIEFSINDKTVIIY